MADPTPAHLDPSALGTKEYWDTLYETELFNHASNPRDEGTVWFDDSDAEAKIVSYLDENAASEYAIDPATAAVLDLGCGNGSLLFALRDEGWKGRLVGVDYSERSVELARRVGVSRRGEGGDGEGEGEEQDGEGGNNQDGDEHNEEGTETEKEVEFKVWDVLNGPLTDLQATPTPTTPTPAGTDSPAPAGGWDLVLDKGTFDAVSLSGEHDSLGRRICEGYGARVLQLLRTGGIFLVTSCNWTEAELRDWFESKTQPTTTTETGATARLRLAGRIEYPSFRFGGVKGQTISTLCFEKVAVV
ncbi:S-adenosyl-L-methionine-dependent methyltransferase [Parachaetomium inaequale]|uniref:Protein-lysine N-methyltransferase EFM4 n=1 Tax=Parachaetomium inaequale TaxID=2588326 RepID=A0AAN6PU50_9PEZI|nr:S-adenosyl-L-methionine-dependent methyltransferase [Parachaetomium inaequale]